MRAALIGYGRMGHMVEDCMAEKGWEVAGIVDFGHLASLTDMQDTPDVAIDFSYPGDLENVLGAAVSRHIPLVIGRTGLSDEQNRMIEEATRHIPIVCAGNFSLGVTVMCRMAREMSAALGEAFDVEIVETHHKMKLDAPSGTARMLVAAVDPSGARPVVYGREGSADKHGGEIGVHALRGGTVAGEHSVHFYGDMEELTIAHRADSRRIFAVGALRAAAFVTARASGLFDMEDVLFGPQNGREE